MLQASLNMSTDRAPNRHLLTASSDDKIEINNINNEIHQRNKDLDDGCHPLPFVALILTTTLFLSAIIFQSNTNSDLNNENGIISSKNGQKIKNWPIVISTWNFIDAVEIAYDTIIKTNDSLQSIITGCSYCEYNPWDCGWSVGYGAKPDSLGEVTLDSLIMYGPTHSAGSVGQLRNIKNAIGVANAIMQHTTHTMLVGESATKFAEMLGFKKESLSNYPRSTKIHKLWKMNECQPNSYMNLPFVNETCPPYFYDYKNDYIDINNKYDAVNEYENNVYYGSYDHSYNEYESDIGYTNHDTIGMIAIDKYGFMTIGTSTNGLRYKIHGRVGDSAVIGHGGYVKQGVGGAVATGNGDIMMLYAPTRIAVYNMELGYDVQKACDMALKDITNDYHNFDGALVCMDKNGNYAASKYMNRAFHYVFKDKSLETAKLLKVS